MNHRFETLVIHAGVDPEPRTGAVMTPIFQTSTYAQSSPGVHLGYEYSRTDNPTRTVLQTQLAALEYAENALVFSSGLAAIDAVTNLLSAGDHVIAGDDLYGGTYRHFTKIASQRGIDFEFVSLANPEVISSHVRHNTKLVWFESPTNPLMQVIDIGAVSAVAKRHGLLVGVDNTFMSPFFQNPLALGADIVMHSMTKYINGHSDVVMGCLAVNDLDLYGRLKFIQNSIGAVPGPFDCWLALRGIKTLAIRMKAHQEGAIAVAKNLEAHPRVDRVLYPGLTSHPQYEIAKRQTSGGGGMITFFLKGDIEDARAFLSRVKLFTLAESLGGVESLIEHPAIMTHASVPQEVRESIGLSDNLVRVSVGIEAPEDLIADLEQAFDY